MFRSILAAPLRRPVRVFPVGPSAGRGWAGSPPLFLLARPMISVRRAPVPRPRPGFVLPFAGSPVRADSFLARAALASSARVARVNVGPPSNWVSSVWKGDWA